MGDVLTSRLILAFSLTIATLAVAACGVTATATPSPTATATAASTGSLVPPIVGQTDTEWGRMWDAIPADFPVYAGATPSEEAATAPASAVLVVNGTDPKTIATWTAKQLTQAGFDINGELAALENGSYAVDGARGTDCLVHVEATPLGTMTTITIYYGASCPAP